MGLDGVELVMEVEDHFGVTIKDAEAQGAQTVGDLVSLIRSRIVAAVAVPCPSMIAFHSLRSLVRQVTGNESLRIRPRDEIAALRQIAGTTAASRTDGLESAEQIFSEVQVIVAEELNIEPAIVQPHTRFADLGF